MARIRIVEGDISAIEAEAIVNAANDNFWMGSGVAGAIKRRGGQEIEDEAIEKGPAPVGEAVVTSAGKLEATYVIHAAVMGQDLQTDAVAIELATLNSLQRAAELNIRSIAFPALGTGVGGFPLKDAAKIMIKVAAAYLRQQTSLEEVIFVLYGKEAYNAFADEAEKYRDKLEISP